MLNWLKRLIHSVDGKPTTLSLLFGRDDCSRAIINFTEHDLSHCKKLVLVWQNEDNSISVVSSDSMSPIEVAGMLSYGHATVLGDKV